MKNLNCKSSNQIKFKLMSLWKFIKVYWQKFKSDANMFSKLKVVLHSNNVMLVMRILVFEMLKYFDFYSCLMKKLFLVSHDFNSDVLIVLMIKAFQTLSKASGPKFWSNFVSIGNMIFQYYIVVALLISVTVIFFKQRALNLLCLQTKKINLLIVHYFTLLIVREFIPK